jgi:hypothetical protein
MSIDRMAQKNITESRRNMQEPSRGPVCPLWYWDATAVTRHVLPPYAMDPPVLAEDPRPSVKNCTFYTPLEGSPGSGATPIMPGGAAGLSMPYDQYQHAVNRESDLFRLDEDLTRCKERRYIPTNPELYKKEPLRASGRSKGAPPIPVPHPAGCREEDDRLAAARSSRLFFNPTRYDRMNTPRKDQALGALVYPSS